MSEYLVSARKYRPQTFDTVVGQGHITTTLKNAIRQQHLAHAYLFCGPRGVGKTTCARILARTINCENPTPDIEACGECGTCQSFNNNASFNVFELDAASNNSVDDIRELVNQVRFAPQQGRYKIYIIDEVHMLSASAFNAFLKTLEEPPPYAIFILATTEKHKILPTILSRCQIFDFRRITTTDTVAHLQIIAQKEGMQASEDALYAIAQRSEGCMRDSLSMLDRIASFTGGLLSYSNTLEHLGGLDAEFYFTLSDHLLASDTSATLLHLDDALARGFEGDAVIAGLAEYYRNLLLCRDPRTIRLLDVPASHRAVFFEKAVQAPVEFVLSALNVLNDAELSYKGAGNKRLHIELCLLRLAWLLQTIQPAELETIKKKQRPEQPRGEESLPATLTAGGPAAPVMPRPPVVIDDPAAPALSAVIPPVAASPIPETGSMLPPRKKVSKMMMDEIDALVNAAPSEAADLKDLCQEDAEKLFADFTQKVRSENRSAQLSQLLQMSPECSATDEITLVSPAVITDAYAREMRNEMIDYFKAQSGRLIRVTTLIREDPDNKATAVAGPLSKNEIYEAMVAANPLLRQLKDGLGLQIDY